MLIITKRKKLGEICGHTVYGVAKSKIITIPHASVLSNVAYSKDEKRFSYVTSACKMENLYLATFILTLLFEIIKLYHLYLDFKTILLSFFFSLLWPSLICTIIVSQVSIRQVNSCWGNCDWIRYMFLFTLSIAVGDNPAA